MSILAKLRRIFARKTKIKMIILLIAIIIGALLETLALSIISPFISLLMDNSVIESNKIIHTVFNFLGFTRINSFLALLSCLLAFVYIFRGLYLYILSKIQYGFIARQRVEISDRLLTKTLSMPYVFHSNHNLADLQRLILADVSMLSIFITNFILFCTDGFMSLFIIVFLMIVSPPMTLCVLTISLFCVFIYFKKFRIQVREAGVQSRIKGIDMTKSVNQALGGIKEVKVLHREEYFRRHFKKNSDEYILAEQKYHVLNALPKLFIESFTFGAAFILVSFVILSGADLQGMVPQLSLFVLAAFRLLPSVSRLVNHVAGILYSRTSIDAVHKSLYEEDEFDVKPATVFEKSSNPPSQDIAIRNVTFSYPNSPESILENVSFTIPNKKSVAFIGTSGAGKTTLADIVLGILTPLEGTVEYNGYSIHHNFDEWVKNVGYIPQQIYILDETILENVAFGLDKENIDEAKVWRALEQAQLREFVESQPEGLYSLVGERGIRLSGGQRQRIGIARALYNDPPFLVLDEATSSLDSETESAVMEAVQGFQGNKTMLIVAHRISTIEHCDIIYRVSDKSIEQTSLEI